MPSAAAPAPTPPAPAAPQRPSPTHELLEQSRAGTAALVRQLQQQAEHSTLLLAELSRRATAERQLAENLTAVFDSFQRLDELAESGDAESYTRTLRKIYALLITVLEAQGMQLLGARGEIASPHTHRVVDRPRYDPQLSENTVLEILGHGLIRDGHVAKPASVLVSTRTPNTTEEA
jgi:molecular chaperone GrpE (heat shock protein)